MSSSPKVTRTLVAGAGTAGIVAFKAFERSSHPALLFDGGPLGTTCARVGCMPSKALIELAKKAHQTTQLAESRILSVESKPQFSLLKALQTVRKLRDHFTNSNIADVHGFGDRFVPANIHFTSSNRATASNGDNIEFENALIAVGSSPFIPDSFIDQRDVFTSDSIFDLEHPIDSLEIIGCGAIGLELAQAFARFGVHVRIYCEEFRLKMLPDQELHSIYHQMIQKEVEIITGVEVFHSGKRNELQIGNESINFEACLLAVGRQSNIQNLGIPVEKIELDESGLRIKNSNFFIAGDAGERGSVVHESEMEGRRAAKMILGQNDPGESRTRIRILFTDPQVAVVERRDHETDSVDEVLLYLTSQGRFTLAQENYGAIKLHIEPRSDVILKAYIVSSQAEHLAHFIFSYIELGRTYKELRHSTFYHPSIYQSFRIKPKRQKENNYV